MEISHYTMYMYSADRYLEDILPLLVLVVRTDCGLEQTEGGHWLLAGLLGLEVAVEQQLIRLQAHVELHPVLVLRPTGQHSGNGHQDNKLHAVATLGIHAQSTMYIDLCILTSCHESQTIFFGRECRVFSATGNKELGDKPHPHPVPFT